MQRIHNVCIQCMQAIGGFLGANRSMAGLLLSNEIRKMLCFVAFFLRVSNLFSIAFEEVGHTPAYTH